MAARTDILDSFSPKPYLRTFGRRDVFTCLSLALFLLAFGTLLDYYSNSDWVGEYQNFTLGLSCFILMIVNHIFYRFEHKRSNNFIGRIINDCLLLMTFMLVAKTIGLLRGGSLNFETGNIASSISMLILIFTLMVCLELLVAAFRRILNLLKWQIF